VLCEHGQACYPTHPSVRSDCGAISDIPSTHHYVNTSDEVLAAVFTAGTDIGCDGYIPPAMPGALADGAITQGQVDTALTNLFSVRMRLGQFDPYELQPMRQWGPDMVCTNDSIALALDAAQQVCGSDQNPPARSTPHPSPHSSHLQGMTLLKNAAIGSGKGLPLSTAGVKTLAVIGPNAQATGTMQGNYNGAPCFTIQSPATALQAYATVTYVAGCDIATNDTSGFPAAIAAAQAADATVLIVGIGEWGQWRIITNKRAHRCPRCCRASDCAQISPRRARATIAPSSPSRARKMR